jgi:hypothetical protein
MGRVERYLTAKMLTRIYVKELALIAAYAKDQEFKSLPA